MQRLISDSLLEQGVGTQVSTRHGLWRSLVAVGLVVDQNFMKRYVKVFQIDIQNSCALKKRMFDFYKKLTRI